MTTALRKLVLALLAAVPVPALADVTARYGMDDTELTIEVDDGGNYRAGVEGKFVVIRRDGRDYVVVYDKGAPLVAELATGVELLLEKIGPAKPSDRPPQRFALTSGGPAEVGEHKGELWTLGRESGEGNRIELVASSEPRLAPVVTVFGDASAIVIRLFRQMAGAEIGNFPPLLTELFSKGAPLRLLLMKDLVLRSVDEAEIDAARFALPGPVLSREKLAAALDETASGEAGAEQLDVPQPH